MKIEFRDLAIWLLLFFLSLAIIKAFMVVSNETTQCVSNPLVYGAKEITEQSKSTLRCTCGFDDQKYEPFILTPEGTSPLKL